MTPVPAVGFSKETDALVDLDSCLREFDRVVNHVSSNKGLIAEDRIAHLLSCWPSTTDVGGKHEDGPANRRAPSV